MDPKNTLREPEQLTRGAPYRRLGAVLNSLFPNNRKGSFASPWPALSGLLEATVLCLAALAFNAWIAPDNPFEVRTEFPWLWIVPAVVAMRYGTAVGVWIVVVLLGTWFLFHAGRLGLLPVDSATPFPQSYFVGGLVLVMICGQFSDVWRNRLQRVMAANAYFNERLQTITRNHFLLRLSHERLEQEMLAKPLTLRETLVHLRDMTRGDSGTADAMPGAREFLHLLGQSCRLEIAAIYPVDASGALLPLPSAHLGLASDLALNDGLVRFSMEHEKLAHLRTTVLASDSKDLSRYLVCLPLRTSSGAILGLLTVEKLPFLALNGDTLQLMTVLAGYYADGLEQHRATAPILACLPCCPPEFALDLVRLCRIFIDSGIPSAMVAFVFKNNAAGLDLFEHVKHINRSIDLPWPITLERHHVLITLLPLAGDIASEGYLLRVEQALRDRFDTDVIHAHVATHVARLRDASPDAILASLLKECDV